ncbi:MAG TPA: hypothetical protein VF721_08405 [Pyrinomonadaceae bacterium]|jgi:hypothetical protein
MKKFNSFVFLPVFFIFQSLFVFAQTDKKAEIKRVDAYCKTVDAFVKKYNGPHLVFAGISDENENKPKWKKYNSEKEFKKAQETVGFYDIAYVWQKNGKIVMTNFTFSSASGDWVHYVYQYFREDGTLAKVEAQLNTFYGNLTVLRDFYFNRNGKLLRKTAKYLDLKTKKPKKPDKQNFYDKEVNIFKKTNSLPFNSLLIKKRK